MKSRPRKNFQAPFNEWLGLRVRSRRREGVTVELEVRDELRNGLGVLHGGVTATLIDVAVGMAVWNHFQKRRKMVTVELKLNYFLPVAEGRVRARARLLRVGSSLVVGAVEVWTASRQLAAFGTATYKLLD